MPQYNYTLLISVMMARATVSYKYVLVPGPGQGLFVFFYLLIKFSGRINESASGLTLTLTNPGLWLADTDFPWPLIGHWSLTMPSSDPEASSAVSLPAPPYTGHLPTPVTLQRSLCSPHFG